MNTSADISGGRYDAQLREPGCRIYPCSRDLDTSRGMWDKSRVFKTYPFFVKSSRWSNLADWNVCLSTQASADLLFWVVEQVKTWKGPLSVAVFAPDVDYTIAILMIQYMRLCFIDVKQRVSFHMVHPDVMPSKLHHYAEKKASLLN